MPRRHDDPNDVQYLPPALRLPRRKRRGRGLWRRHGAGNSRPRERGVWRPGPVLRPNVADTRLENLLANVGRRLGGASGEAAAALCAAGNAAARARSGPHRAPGVTLAGAIGRTARAECRRPEGQLRRAEELARVLRILFRALVPMRNRVYMRAVIGAIETMRHEEAAYWAGMAIRRRHPHRVLMALRILLTDGAPRSCGTPPASGHGAHRPGEKGA